MPAISSKRAKPHHFVPDDLDTTDAEAITRLYDKLDERNISTLDALTKFIHDWDELTGVLYETRTAAYVDMTSDTTNPQFEATYQKVIEEIVPVGEKRSFRLKQKLLESPALSELGDEYGVFLRHIRAEVGIFREENVPLMTEERKQDQEFQKISGAQKAQFRGETYTLPQLGPFLEETDRTTREEAWRARLDARLADAEALDTLFDQMYETRQQIARNAGFDSYRDYKFVEYKRFDYTPEDCLRFHAAIEKHVVPVVTRDNERRGRLLGLDTLRPWDMLVDPENHEPPRPFKNAQELKDGCERIFERIDPELAGYFRTMVAENLLDLENRPGKAPGGYMDALTDTGVPFIFMNAVGTHRDVETLLHEGGHAFHYYLARRQPLINYQALGIGAEIAEVGSMSMEYLSLPYLGEFYSDDEVQRLYDHKLRDSLQWFPFMAMIDAFQHWFYTAEKHGPQERRAKWAELEARFRPELDWSGLEQYRDIGWQYLHVFSFPFYFIEYAIAQLAAMRIWLNSLEDERGAIEAYKRGLSLGGSRPLPELFEAAGAQLGLDERTVGAIVEGTLAQMAAKD
ncbi:MAG TPA: M3 family oligoendopeptidase [Chloroflexia bacterium]|nr:M3 family oligoendopeptidase [Chloroflexia bacterium]